MRIIPEEAAPYNLPLGNVFGYRAERIEITSAERARLEAMERENPSQYAAHMMQFQARVPTYSGIYLVGTNKRLWRGTRLVRDEDSYVRGKKYGL